MERIKEFKEILLKDYFNLIDLSIPKIKPSARSTQWLALPAVLCGFRESDIRP